MRYDELGEANEAWNNQQRRLIEEFAEHHGAAYLGVFNPHGGYGGHGTHARWDGSTVLNFSADFAVPAFDAELDRLLHARVAAQYTGTRDDAARIKDIFLRIESLGGVLLVWT